MLRIHFTAEDLARTTLATEPDPLWEVLLSLHMAQSNDGQVVFEGWRRSLGRMTPSPELTSADVMRRLGHAVRSYYESALSPYWQSIRQHVVADRVRRMQTWTSGGVDQLLSALHPGARWSPPVLGIRDFVDTEVHLDGRGLTLQPSFFCWQTPTKLRDNGLAPILVYPTQPPPGALSRRRSQRASLVALLGRTWAFALNATVSGCTTSELAKRCGVSLAAASQQATVLREAALITTRRDGGAVQHEITALGLSLLNSAELPV